MNNTPPSFSLYFQTKKKAPRKVVNVFNQNYVRKTTLKVWNLQFSKDRTNVSR